MTNRQIHPSAIISPFAELAEDVKIGPLCYVGPRVKLKSGVELKSHVVIDGITSVGEGTVLYPFASIGSAPQDLKYRGEESEVIIGKNNSVREYVTIQPGTQGGGMITSVGDNCLFMVGAHIAHDCRVGNNVIMANYASLGGHVVIGDYVIIGGLAAVLQHVRIGAHAIIGGVSAVVRDIIPFGLANSDRASLEGINLNGLKKRGFDKEQSYQASIAVEEIFNDDTKLFDDKVDYVKNKYPNNVIVRQIIEFLEQSNTRSICTFRKK